MHRVVAGIPKRASLGDALFAKTMIPIQFGEVRIQPANLRKKAISI
jgi:hypothetical protein